MVVPCAANGAVGGLRGELVADSAAKTVLCDVVVLIRVNLRVVEEIASGRAPTAGGVVRRVRVLRLARTTDRAVGDSVGELFAADAGETVLRGVVVLCSVNSSVVEEESPGRAPACDSVFWRVYAASRLVPGDRVHVLLLAARSGPRSSGVPPAV